MCEGGDWFPPLEGPEALTTLQDRKGDPGVASVHWRPGSYLARHARCAIAIPAVGTMARHALRAAKSKAQPSISKQRSGFCQPHVIYSQGGLANRVLLDQCLLLACPASGHPSSGGCLCWCAACTSQRNRRTSSA